MCARLTSLLLAAAWVAGAGCASKSAEEPSAAAPVDHACGSASSAAQVNDHDIDIDSILAQPTSDPRLARINRRMYQSLRTLDAELRRERSLAACEQHPLDSAPLQAQTNNQQDAGGGAVTAEKRGGDVGVAAGPAGGAAAHATADGAIGTNAIAASLQVPANAAAASGPGAPGAAAAHATSIRKASLANGRGGNGATAPKVIPGSDNDIVTRRLRKAAEQETNPALRAKLWKEYTDYRQGTSAK